MFDIAPSEFLLLGIVALIFIGPKDLPRAMRVVGQFVGKARGMARQFRSGFDSMMREAELEEMEAKWKAENERIMAEYAAIPAALTAPTEALPAPDEATPEAPAAPEPPAPASEPTRGHRG